ncbi:copper-binding protein [Enterobacter huaxiensis]|jgi:Cu(I)/Ag(I) efflux system protein CusF|uniref:Copper-binding protein n=1 Tax=Enterobacter huaxiensis TaxID=2494702 RepID=A0A428LRQ0_9ENTR|nr:copper-binding protein [Enterobacter huaxiensis]MCS5451837.1 copper-binding protein [Enterobacter huaxiensis]MEB7542382.1 copper-binding protein [Enterobacter huaxiensis]MEB7581219.1 copper-binding protein [Enterobacter huaxiensis]MEB7663304.1 copper-binding protein [Enterobacter huaxiensis]RSK67509.1 copper-binding protein [Enterobacter huaxiensis]
MRALYLSALLGASVSFASYSVQANQSWQGHGVVQSVSKDAVMLQHDAIPELKWPAMTMPFTLSAGAELNGAKPGDEVTFTLERAGDGFQIVSLTPKR